MILFSCKRSSEYWILACQFNNFIHQSIGSSISLGQGRYKYVILVHRNSRPQLWRHSLALARVVDDVHECVCWIISWIIILYEGFSSWGEGYLPHILFKEIWNIVKIRFKINLLLNQQKRPARMDWPSLPVLL